MTDKLKQAIEALERADRTQGWHVLECLDVALSALRSAAPERVGEWQRVAHVFGERLGRTGPDGYYAMTPDQWLEWATNELEHLMYRGNRNLAPQPQTVSREAIANLVRKSGDENWTDGKLIDAIYALQLPATQPVSTGMDGLQVSSDGAVTVNGKRWGQWPDTAHRVTAYDAAKEYADPQNSILVPVCSYSAALQDRNSLIRAIHAHLLSRQPHSRIEEVRELLEQIATVEPTEGMELWISTVKIRARMELAALAKLDKGGE